MLENFDDELGESRKKFVNKVYKRLPNEIAIKIRR